MQKADSVFQGAKEFSPRLHVFKDAMATLFSKVIFDTAGLGNKSDKLFRFMYVEAIGDEVPPCFRVLATISYETRPAMKAHYELPMSCGTCNVVRKMSTAAQPTIVELWKELIESTVETLTAPVSASMRNLPMFEISQRLRQKFLFP